QAAARTHLVEMCFGSRIHFARNKSAAAERVVAVRRDGVHQRTLEIVLGLPVDEHILGEVIQRLLVAPPRIRAVGPAVPLIGEQRLPARRSPATPNADAMSASARTASAQRIGGTLQRGRMPRVIRL